MTQIATLAVKSLWVYCRSQGTFLPTVSVANPDPYDPLRNSLLRIL